MTTSWSSEMWADFAAAVLPVLSPEVATEQGAEHAKLQPQVFSAPFTSTPLPLIERMMY